MKPHDPTLWHDLLRELRKEARLTQKELAQYTGLSQRTIADYENPKRGRQLSINKVERIVDTLGYDLDIILRAD
ncbi:MAG: helix-turn-helix transcriptional regulator [Alphaproteobacteria bacterium]|jgi:transcriptional regulator with XRE-family HTH domain|nr:helix-turn-helix transcriptional regulator [Alphaproteobacteria bacterium]MDP7190375.1 helix-turn-helix transcriptional regulator [Alphaproteobacteria bacterium]|tara:strand:- start:1782 stop:2003 length:222 start_codon:yes stop_codon:yes gene_type:complete